MQLGSLPQSTSDKRVNEALTNLSIKCGYSGEGAQALFSEELATLIRELKDSYEEWERYSTERFVFDMLLRRSSSEAIIEHWFDVLLIISANVHADKEYEVRIDMLSLLEFLMN